MTVRLKLGLWPGRVSQDDLRSNRKGRYRGAKVGTEPVPPAYANRYFWAIAKFLQRAKSSRRTMRCCSRINHPEIRVATDGVYFSVLWL
jgi:hypothetical protein